jgi:hypothetical protein
LFVSLLGGCGPEPQAPSPAVNPHPHEFTKLKITVEPGAGVTGIRVESLWNVGNIGCAPHEGWPSGASITKQVNTPEKVDKTGTDEWVATVVDDRFLPDKCRWHGGGYGIHFMRDQGILSGVGTGKDELDLISTLKITCTFDEPHGWPGACFNRDQEASLKARQAQVFNATVEIMQ